MNKPQAVTLADRVRKDPRYRNAFTFPMKGQQFGVRATTTEGDGVTFRSPGEFQPTREEAVNV